jgi:hypothetical protein
MDVHRWEHPPYIAEVVYSLMDALVVGGLLYYLNYPGIC